MISQQEKTWPNYITELMYTMRGLTVFERKYINISLKIGTLRTFVNLRYAPDPQRYDKMNKKQLIMELKHPRYS